MTIFAICAFSFASFSVWLCVGIVNRRERWAIRLAKAIAVSSPFLFVASFGPACWIAGTDTAAMRVVSNAYYPILWLADFTRNDISPGVRELSALDELINWYATLGRSDGLWPGLRPDGGTTWMGPPPEDPTRPFGMSPDDEFVVSGPFSVMPELPAANIDDGSEPN